MTQESHSKIVRDSHCELLFNPLVLDSPAPSYLRSGILQQADFYEPVSAGGRGQAWFVEVAGLSVVLRAYQRGGVPAIFNRETYLGVMAENSRGFREWRLLQWMFEAGLPVPRPVAASVCRWPVPYSPFYRAHILIERIPATHTLDQVLCEKALNREIWKKIGECILGFHHRGIFHADLNANNILLDQNNTVYLIDFDKSERRESQRVNAPWKVDNLNRLKRSLIKQQGKHPEYYYVEDDWNALLDGYQG